MAVTKEMALWEGIASLEIRMSEDRIEVTTFGDSAARYVAGPMRYRLEAELTDRATLDRLLALLSTKYEEREIQERATPPLVLRPVRFIDLEE